MVVNLLEMQENNKMKYKNILMSIACVLVLMLLVSASTGFCFPGSGWSFQELKYNIFMLLPIVITSIMGKLWETFLGAFFGMVVFFFFLMSTCSGAGSSDPFIFVTIFIAVPIASLLGIGVGSFLSRKPGEK